MGRHSPDTHQRTLSPSLSTEQLRSAVRIRQAAQSYTDPERHHREVGRYQGRALRYFLPVVLAVPWVLIVFGLMLAHGDPPLWAFFWLIAPPVSAPVVGVSWWLYDRYQVDPIGHGTRVRGILWAITLFWGGSKLLK